MEREKGGDQRPETTWAGSSLTASGSEAPRRSLTLSNLCSSGRRVSPCRTIPCPPSGSQSWSRLEVVVRVRRLDVLEVLLEEVPEVLRLDAVRRPGRGGDGLADLRSSDSRRNSKCLASGPSCAQRTTTSMSSSFGSVLATIAPLLACAPTPVARVCVLGVCGRASRMPGESRHGHMRPRRQIHAHTTLFCASNGTSGTTIRGKKPKIEQPKRGINSTRAHLLRTPGKSFLDDESD